MTVIGIIGAGECDEKTAGLAYSVGRLVAQRGAALVCGGLDGVMEAACKGAVEAGGLTIGVLPGWDRDGANPYVKVPLVTDMGHARNVIIAHTAQGLIAISGEYGTLSEIAISLKLGRPVVSLGSWPGIEELINVDTPEEAVEAIFERIV